MMDSMSCCGDTIYTWLKDVTGVRPDSSSPLSGVNLQHGAPRECMEALLCWLLVGFAGGKGKMTNVWIIKCLTVY